MGVNLAAAWMAWAKVVQEPLSVVLLVVLYLRPRPSICYFTFLALSFTYPIRGWDHNKSLLRSLSRARGQRTGWGCFEAALTHMKGERVVLVVCSAPRESDTESSLAASSQNKGTRRGGVCPRAPSIPVLQRTPPPPRYKTRVTVFIVLGSKGWVT